MNRREEEENGGDQRRLRKVGMDVSGSLTSGRPLSAFKPINLYLPGHLFLTQRLLKRLQQTKQGIMGSGCSSELQWDSWVARVPSESAVSCFHAPVLGRPAASPGRAARLPAGGLSGLRSQARLTHRRACASKEAKGDAAATDPRKKLGTRELSKSLNLEGWVGCESTRSLPLVGEKKKTISIDFKTSLKHQCKFKKKCKTAQFNKALLLFPFLFLPRKGPIKYSSSKPNHANDISLLFVVLIIQEKTIYVNIHLIQGANRKSLLFFWWHQSSQRSETCQTWHINITPLSSHLTDPEKALVTKMTSKKPHKKLGLHIINNTLE